VSRIRSFVWGLRVHLYWALDRPGGRGLLGWLATRFARRETGDDVGIVYRGGVWLLRLGDDYAPGSTRFIYRHGDEIRPRYEALYEATRDHWLQLYRPQPGDVIVDGGAWTGNDTFVFSKLVGSEGRVLSIEAQPETFRVLTTVCEQN
jgi:hypothetical protein